MGYQHIDEAVTFVEGESVAVIVGIVASPFDNNLTSHISEQAIEFSGCPLSPCRYLDLDVDICEPDICGVLILLCH
tara:strand:- start:508 stop:735 length:228 start_codon:yes stop_codon:yes gene_type:complete